VSAGPARQVAQPRAGLRVVEFTHRVMGPTCGVVLADLGAEVIKVDPLDGKRLGVRLDPVQRGEHSREVLREFGVSDAEIDALFACDTVV